MPVGVIWSAWRGHKISDDDVSKELIRSRDRGAVSALQEVEVLIKRARTQDLECEIRQVQGLLQSQQTCFTSHALITKWFAQFENSRCGVDDRKKCVFVVGDSQQGKTTMALSLLGPEKTLNVSCQGLPRGVLPDLRRFDIEGVDHVPGGVGIPVGARIRCGPHGTRHPLGDQRPDVHADEHAKREDPAHPAHPHHARAASDRIRPIRRVRFMKHP